MASFPAQTIVHSGRILTFTSSKGEGFVNKGKKKKKTNRKKIKPGGKIKSANVLLYLKVILQIERMIISKKKGRTQCFSIRWAATVCST